MTYLVTGGAGFIGGHLADELLSKGKEVVIIDDMSTGKKDNIPEKAIFYEKDINDDLADIFEKHKFEAVFHLAGKIITLESIDKPKETNEVNVTGSINVLEHCRKFGVKKFVFASSAAVYGDSEKLPLREDEEVIPSNPYGLQKFIVENYARMYNLYHGINAVCLRFFNVFGPRQNTKTEYAILIPKFIEMIKEGRNPTIYGDGEQTRDFVFVKDLIAGIIAAGEADLEFEIINLAGGVARSVNETTEKLLKLAGSNLEAKHLEERPEIKHSRADVSKAKALLNWEASTDFDEALKETHEFFTKSL